MKYIVAVIQSDRLEEVLDLLEKKEIHLVTVSNVLGRGRQKGIAEIYDVDAHSPTFQFRLKKSENNKRKSVSSGVQ